MTYIGSNRFSALYGLHDTIVDQKAIGIQHLYIDNYEYDLIHTALSVVTVDGKSYFGNRVKPTYGHAIKHDAKKSFVENYAIMVDVFEYDEFSKTDFVGVTEETIRFQTVIRNTSGQQKTYKLSALSITQPGHKKSFKVIDNYVIYNIYDKHFGIVSTNTKDIYVSKDAPSGFMYHGLEDIVHHKNLYLEKVITEHALASSLNFEVSIEPNASYTFDWAIVIGNSESDLIHKLKNFTFVKDFNDVKSYWNNYLSKVHASSIYEYETKTKLVALKGALLDGFLPADLTGHYFARNKPCFYVRDALMGSRAFLYAGLYEDFESIIKFLLACEVKDNNEFYQRYNVYKKPDEGANNNVFSQIDYIGYFGAVVRDYYKKSNKLICSFEKLRNIVDILDHIPTKSGLYGPEGGVNEGVYGPAFINSTNMFIASGLKQASMLALELGYKNEANKWHKRYESLKRAIENTYIEKVFYPYGYVDYQDEIILRYDTPQLLAASLGYPITNNYKENFYGLLKHATYDTYGFGYSEQEYHDGPWIFNTSAAAQVAYLIGDTDHYNAIMKWLKDHQNGYLLLPEAIDASNPNNCHINPLMWANAEFVVAVYSDQLKKLRGK